MRRLSFLAVIAVVGLSVVHCGKTPLTPAQRAQVEEVTSSANQVKSAASSVREATKLAWMKDGGDSDAILKALEGADCEFKTPELKNPSKGLDSMNFSMGGPKCPMTMEMQFKVENQGREIVLKFAFELTDPELAKLSDVTKVTMEGKLSGDESGGQGTMTGAIHSKKYGEVGVELEAEMSQSSSLLAVTYDFGEFEAMVEVETDAEGTVYRLNGEEITQEEFQKLMVFGGELAGNGQVAKP